jgi:hypothetical protein
VARAHPGKIGFKGARYEGLTCDLLPFVWSAGGSVQSLGSRREAPELEHACPQPWPAEDHGPHFASRLTRPTVEEAS